MSRATTPGSDMSSTTQRAVSSYKSCTVCGRGHLIMGKGTSQSGTDASWTCRKCQASPKRAEEFEKAQQVVQTESRVPNKAPAPVTGSVQASEKQDIIDYDDESEDDLPGRFTIGGAQNKFLGKKQR